MLSSEEIHRLLIDGARVVDAVVFLLEPGESNPRNHFRVNGYKAFVNTPRSLYFFVAKLKVYVRLPRLFFRLPLHPALKHLPRTCSNYQMLATSTYMVN